MYFESAPESFLPNTLLQKLFFGGSSVMGTSAGWASTGAGRAVATVGVPALGAATIGVSGFTSTTCTGTGLMAGWAGAVLAALTGADGLVVTTRCVTTLEAFGGDFTSGAGWAGVGFSTGGVAAATFTSGCSRLRASELTSSQLAGR